MCELATAGFARLQRRYCTAVRASAGDEQKQSASRIKLHAVDSRSIIQVSRDPPKRSRETSWSNAVCRSPDRVKTASRR